MRIGLKARPLHSRDLGKIPDDVRAALTVQITGFKDPDPNEETALAAWWQAVELEWGPPSVALCHDHVAISGSVFCPPSHLGLAGRNKPTISDGAVGIIAVWSPTSSPTTLRLLLQGVLRESAVRHADAVEAHASIGGDGLGLSAAELVANGFALHRPHPVSPLYRLEIRKTLQLSSWAGQVMERLSSLLTPAPEPSGAGDMGPRMDPDSRPLRRLDEVRKLAE